MPNFDLERKYKQKTNKKGRVQTVVFKIIFAIHERKTNELKR